MPRIDQDLSGVQDDDLVATGGGWRALPDGDYSCVLVESDYKTTQGGNGKFLKLKFEVLEDGLRDRSFFDNMTLQHPNPDTVRIARAQLKRLALAVRHPQPDFVGDSVELHGVPLIATLRRSKAKNEKFGDADGYENRVTDYRIAGSAPPARAAAPQPAAASNGGKALPF